MKPVGRVKSTSGRLYEYNSLDDPARIAPVKAAFAGEGKTLTATVPPQCFTVFVITK